MNGFKLAAALAVCSSLILGGASTRAGDIYTLNAYMGPDSTRVKEVVLDKGKYIAYVNVDQGDPTKVEIEAELVREEVRVEAYPKQKCKAQTLKVEFTVDKDDTRYKVTVRNTSEQQIEIYLKLKEKD